MLGWIYSFELVVRVSLDIFPEVESLGHKAVLFLIFDVTPYCFPQSLHQCASPPTVHNGSLFSTSLSTLLLVDLLMITTLISVRWYLLMVLFCISLMISSIEHLFIYLLVIIFMSLWGSVYSALPIFKLDFFLVLSFINSLWILDINPLSDVSLMNIFSHSVGCLLIFVDGFLCCANKKKYFLFFSYWFEREREREETLFLLLHLFIHSLVDSCMFSDGGFNPQPGHISTML